MLLTWAHRKFRRFDPYALPRIKPCQYSRGRYFLARNRKIDDERFTFGADEVGRVGYAAQIKMFKEHRRSPTGP